MNAKPKWTAWHTLAIVASSLAILVLGLIVPSSYRVWAWLITIVLLTLVAAIAGEGITGKWYGVLIDDRNKISLSRLQMVMWTIIILSGFLTAGLANIDSAQSDPLAVTIPPELWLAMGISITSLIGTPLIHNVKQDKTPSDQETAQTMDLLVTKQKVDPNSLDTKGQIMVNKTPDDARWSDLFRGEETGNAASLDLSKMQMFYFTLILVLAYLAALAALFTGAAAAITALPVLDQSAVALLGISHAGYLVSKAAPHSATG
jgi:hypothetical protein